MKLNQLIHPAKSGAVSGAFWGMLVGWLFMMPLAGAAVGAAGGALGGSLVDVGINDDEMRKQANDALKPGTAGLFLLIRKMTTDKVLEDLKGVGGTVIKTSFDNAKEEALRAALAAPVPAQPATPAPAPAAGGRRGRSADGLTLTRRRSGNPGAFSGRYAEAKGSGGEGARARGLAGLPPAAWSSRPTPGRSIYLAAG